MVNHAPRYDILMCGIAGVYGRVDEATLDRMLQRLVHRGPDESGRHLAPNAGLMMGMRRLSIVDLEGGSQPIYNEDGSVVVVFNGEIYNHRNIRADLEEAGHRFSTDSDTEVLVHLWEEYGEHTPEYLDGMFAFAVWDEDEETLFLARDRLGIKPLYYATGERLSDNAQSAFVWGSELPAVLSAGVSRSIDESAVYNFFSLRYSPWPHTLFNNVKKLRPGTSLSVTSDGIATNQYWRLQERKVSGSRSNAARRIRNLLEKSVRRRLMADVPIGTFLSGGLDSSAVTGLAAKHHDDTLKTFSVGFPGQSQDESEEAQFVSDHFGTDHHCLDVDLDSLDAFGDLVQRCGEPLADPAALPTMLLSRYARDEVKVVLTGEGADELFSGYRRHRVIPRHRRVARFLPTKVFTMADRLAETTHFGRRYTRYVASLRSDAQAVLDAARRYSDPRPERYLETQMTPDGSGLTAMVGNAVPDSNDSDMLKMLCSFDIHHWLPDDLLYKVDIASMAASLEARVPFLDHRLVEFAYNVPSEYKRDGYKRVLRQAVEDLVPEQTRERDKQGFNVPVSMWFRDDHDVITHWLSEERIKPVPYLDTANVFELWKRHRNKKIDYGMTLWKILTYVAWYHEHAMEYAER